MRGHPTLVLVHSPLVGASAWQPVARLLGARGHTTVVPNLAGVLADAGPYYARLAATVADDIARRDEERIVLVGHSGAGTLLPAVAHATAATVVGMVFVDASLPHPGRAWFDAGPTEMRDQLQGLARQGTLPPWNEWFPPGTIEELLPDPALRGRFCAELPRVPLAYFDEPAPECPDPSPAHSAYLQLSDVYSAEADQAEREGWRVRRRQTHHLAILTEPEEVSATLEELIQDFVA
ncbi:alpha/beta fold hydrolase [Streptomyces flaveus]|uniref:alpha/beta fold hydrolase n=1 Tax=Streptomyces flaveus TaxID=66370 RepID=UPI00332E358F